ncbi:hypothetical protein TBLA_0I00780 [Henningerozyma blattae CBS 6284]|uniref:ER membrane protein complex subunit 2 n=1 Tax=Henningerozyma blattae (strain ATCC 34711 / CBS 6284 / DSM 70876 / NBRC 10599 / NRRL Y-10934 / UCD 77-7) TaxID=1071380 RepID=I2H8N4_HENB6|nr:hypothetical protein TBLA_0I00780 [Tetrapisispora blattae CBS 6284]CCH62736.1 hypothetical protein TBLA_0I00780 [Tetrapisispora blattae CBS 6284]
MTKGLTGTRERFQTIVLTKLYTQLEPKALLELHDDLELYLHTKDPERNDGLELSLWDMMFYLKVYLSKDIEATVIYNNLRDKFGEHSPNLYLMKVTLLQINKNDTVAINFINNSIDQVLEFDTDPYSYLLLSKRLITMQNNVKTNKPDDTLRHIMELIEKFPIDPELWWYAGEKYFELGLFDQAIYCFEELVVLMPFNYVAFAKISEILYLKALKLDKKKIKNNKELFDIVLQEALDNALRSVELSELYLKGWTLILLITKQMNDKKQFFDIARENLDKITRVSNSSDKITAEYILNKVN